MTPREELTAALHAHSCHADGELCAWAGEDYLDDGTCVISRRANKFAATRTKPTGVGYYEARDRLSVR